MNGYVVLVSACLLTALALPVGRAWSRLAQWRYPRREDSMLGQELLGGQLPEEAVAMWAAHDPGPLGFVCLGELQAGVYWGGDALTRLWVDERTRTTVAAVTFAPSRTGGPAACRRGFTTYHGHAAELGSLQVQAGDSALLYRLTRPGIQSLVWPTDSQAELLMVHRRQLLAAGPRAIAISSLDDLRQLTSRVQDAQRDWLLSSGVLREEDDGKLALRGRALVRSVWGRLPTVRMAVRRADRRARRTVAGWPETDPAVGP